MGVRCSANRMRFVHLVLEHLGIQMPDKGYLNWSVLLEQTRHFRLKNRIRNPT